MVKGKELNYHYMWGTHNIPYKYIKEMDQRYWIGRKWNLPTKPMAQTIGILTITNAGHAANMPPLFFYCNKHFSSFLVYAVHLGHRFANFLHTKSLLFVPLAW